MVTKYIYCYSFSFPPNVTLMDLMTTNSAVKNVSNVKRKWRSVHCILTITGAKSMQSIHRYEGLSVPVNRYIHINDMKI